MSERKEHGDQVMGGTAGRAMLSQPQGRRVGPLPDATSKVFVAVERPGLEVALVALGIVHLDNGVLVGSEWLRALAAWHGSSQELVETATRLVELLGPL